MNKMEILIDRKCKKILKMKNTINKNSLEQFKDKFKQAEEKCQ